MDPSLTPAPSRDLDEEPDEPSSRPSRFDTPTIEWLIEEMERYAPKDNALNRTIERVNPECVTAPGAVQPDSSHQYFGTTNLNQPSIRTPGVKSSQKVDEIDDEQEYGKC